MTSAANGGSGADGEQTVADIVSRLHNICYADKREEIQPRDVEVALLSSSEGRLAACKGYDSETVRFEYDPEWWGYQPTAVIVGLLCHELAHVVHDNHSPSFWEQVIRNYNRMAESTERVEDLFRSDGIDWKRTRAYLVNDPSPTSVDRRSERVFERRVRMAEEIGYSGEVTDFRNTKVSMPMPRDESERRVEVCEIERDSVESDTAFELAINSNPVSCSGNVYEVDPIRVREDGSGYTAFDRQSEVLVDFVNRAGHRRVTIEIVGETVDG